MDPRLWAGKRKIEHKRSKKESAKSKETEAGQHRETLNMHNALGRDWEDQEGLG